MHVVLQSYWHLSEFAQFLLHLLWRIRWPDLGSAASWTHKYMVTPHYEAMIHFVLKAFAVHETVEADVALDCDVLNCFDWIAGKDKTECIRRRESMIQAIVRDAR